MAKYIIKRFIGMVLVMVIVASLVFLMVNAMPGDPVFLVAGTNEIDQEAYDIIYHELGLDKPVYVRFFEWLTNAVQGDFGKSYYYHKPVMDVLGQRIVVTLYLALVSTVISFPVGIFFGTIAAVKRGKKADTIITTTANILGCIPVFFLGVILLYLFAMKLRWLPTMGFSWPWDGGLGKHIKHMIMPLFCMSIGGAAMIARQTRSAMLEVIRQDFVRTARSKGLRESKVISIHVLKNGLIPVVTMFGFRLAYMVGGSIFVESVFGIPGMGSLILACITSHDIPMIQAIVFVTALCTSIAFIVTDLLYVIVDPRISLTESN